MPENSLNPAPELWAPQDLLALQRFVERNLDLGFRLAVVESESHAEREQVLAPMRSRVGPRILQVDVAQLEGHNLWQELLTLFREADPRLVVLSGVVSGTPHDYMRQLNVQRDLFTRDMKVPWIVFLHPAQRVPLLTIAPDFSDYVALWVHRLATAPNAGLPDPLPLPGPLTMPPTPLPLDVDPLLQNAGLAIESAQLDSAQDLLSRFDLRVDPPWEERMHRQILGARLAYRKGQHRSAENLLRSCRDELTQREPPGTASTNRYVLELSLGQVLLGQGRFSEAADAFQRSVDAAQQVFGIDSAICWIPRMQRAEALWCQGKPAEAVAALMYCVARVDQAPDITLDILRALLLQAAQLLCASGEYAEAEPLLRQLVEVDAARGDAASLASSQVWEILAISLRNQGKYGEAEELLRRSLRQVETQLGVHHQRSALAATLLAGVLIDQGKLPEAEELLRRSLAIEERHVGTAHFRYALTLFTLAKVLFGQHKQAEAESLIARCMAIIERTVGGGHPAYAAMAIQLAEVRLALGRGDEAEELAKQALTITEQVFGALHPDVGYRLYALAFIQRKLGRPQAAQTAQRAVEVLSQSLGPEHSAAKQAVALQKSLLGLQEAPKQAVG